jgi:hypothetical protein
LGAIAEKTGDNDDDNVDDACADVRHDEEDDTGEDGFDLIQLLSELCGNGAYCAAGGGMVPFTVLGPVWMKRRSSRGRRRGRSD